MSITQSTAGAGGGDEKPCHWGGGNDIIWCSTCGAEYAYAKGETRPDCPLTSAPPAPTPEAGSDLAKLSARATKGPWTLRDKCILGPSTNPHIPSPDVVASSAYSDRSLQDDADNLRFLFALAEGYRSGRLVEASASPPPGEDLAGQGEPHSGYLFRNPDTGTEWSENHPVESGGCDDAEEVRPATLIALREELFSAWEDAAEQRRERDEVREAFMRVAEVVGVPASERLDLEVAARIARAPDLAGQGEQTDPIFRERAACAYLAECHTGLWDNATAEAIATAIRERDPSQDDFAMVAKEAWAAVQPVWLFLRHGEPLPDDLAAKLAPAPSRPADREEIATALRNVIGLFDGDGALSCSGEHQVQVVAAARSIIALRDAPRTGGDGWRPIHTAVKDDRSVMLGLWDKITDDPQDWRWIAIAGWYEAGPADRCWYDITDNRIEPTHWLPMEAPPSPNAGDGTQDTQRGGR